MTNETFFDQCYTRYVSLTNKIGGEVESKETMLAMREQDTNDLLVEGTGKSDEDIIKDLRAKLIEEEKKGIEELRTRMNSDAEEFKDKPNKSAWQKRIAMRKEKAKQEAVARVDKAFDAISKAGDKMDKRGQDALIKVFNAYEKLLRKVWENLVVFFVKVVEFIVETWNKIKAFIKDTFNKIKDFFKNLF